MKIRKKNGKLVTNPIVCLSRTWTNSAVINAEMPMYSKVNNGYPSNVSALIRQTLLNCNQNHQSLPSNVTSQTIKPIVDQQPVSSLNLTSLNNLSNTLCTMTTHSNVSSTQTASLQTNVVDSAVIITSNITTSKNTALPINPRHEVKLNAMP